MREREIPRPNTVNDSAGSSWTVVVMEFLYTNFCGRRVEVVCHWFSLVRLMAKNGAKSIQRDLKRLQSSDANGQRRLGLKEDLLQWCERNIAQWKETKTAGCGTLSASASRGFRFRRASRVTCISRSSFPYRMRSKGSRWCFPKSPLLTVYLPLSLIYNKRLVLPT